MLLSLIIAKFYPEKEKSVLHTKLDTVFRKATTTPDHLKEVSLSLFSQTTNRIAWL